MSSVNSNPQNRVEEFCQEFRALWQQLPNKAFFFGLLAAWFALFQFFGHCSFNFTKVPSIFSWMWGAYSAPALDSEHGKLIPGAVLLLFWLKRKELLPEAKNVWWPALIGLFLSVLLHIIGYAIQQPRISLVAFFGGVYSLLGLTWGYRFVGACFFPFVLFAFAVPLGNSINVITVPLRLFATTVTRIIASGLGIHLIQQGNQLFDPEGGYGYEIVTACSGIRSLIPVIVITLIYAMLNFRSPAKRILLLAFAVPLAVACNIFRVLAIVLTRNIIDEHAALFVHEWFGFVTYLLTLTGAFLLGTYLSRNERRQLVGGKTA